MHLLVLGANGLLGSRVVKTATSGDWAVSGTYHSEEPAFDIDLYRLDIRDVERFESLLDEVEPTWVANCAAMTDVDACETDPESAQTINGEAPGVMASRCRERGVGFCHISTDYVFDGEADQPYSEDDETGPIQAYGESKLAGERAVRESIESALVLRLSFVYGIHGATGDLTGFPAWVRDQLQSEGQTPLFTDQWVTPTRAGQAASVLLRLIERGSSGLYHVASRSCVTPYEFGLAVRESMASPTGTLVQGAMKDVERSADRPQYTCLDVSKVEAELGGEQPTLRTDLEAIAGAF